MYLNNNSEIFFDFYGVDNREIKMAAMCDGCSCYRKKKEREVVMSLGVYINV